MSPRRLSSAFVMWSCLVLAGCEPPDIRVAASKLPPYQTTVDQPKNIIEEALDHCPDKTAKREAACVKQALADGHTSVAALAAMIPGCRIGQTCTYAYTTKDRLGYLPAMAAEFVARWRVGFDLRHGAAAASDVPISVDAV